MRTGSVWEARAPRASGGFPTTAPPQRCEVLIVGGGITGVALLGALRQRDVDAVLCERGTIGCGASGRNAGFLLAGVAENYARAASVHGRDVAAAIWRFTLDNHELIARSSAATAAQHRRRGSLIAAVDGDEGTSLEEAATLLREDGFAAELRPGSGTAPVALFNPDDGEIDPLRLVRALAAGNADRVVEHCDVTALGDAEDGVRVHAGGGEIDAEAVVIATNAWISQLVPSVDVRPVRAQMLATAPTSRCFDVPVYADWGHGYWRQRDDGRVLLGGFRNRAPDVEVGFDAAPTGEIQAHLDGHLRELGVVAEVTHRWAGTMGFSADGLPLLGRAPGSRRVHVCGGYTGHGMGFAFNAAASLTGLLLDATAVPEWLDAGRNRAVKRLP